MHATSHERQQMGWTPSPRYLKNYFNRHLGANFSTEQDPQFLQKIGSIFCFIYFLTKKFLFFDKESLIFMIFSTKAFTNLEIDLLICKIYNNGKDTEKKNER